MHLTQALHTCACTTQLLSKRAGGCGLNLQAACVVILLDTAWNGLLDQQVWFLNSRGDAARNREMSFCTFHVDSIPQLLNQAAVCLSPCV